MPRAAALRPGVLFLLSTAVVVSAVASSPADAQEILLHRLAQVDSYRSTPPEPRPAAVLRRRADNLVLQLLVTDDTRDATARLKELVEAIGTLAEAARRSDDVDIALVVETVDGLSLVRPFDRDDAIAMIENGGRPDTSQVRLLAKTAIVESDKDQRQPAARIDRFLAGIQLAGRAQLDRFDDASLTVVKPEQYRSAIVSAIAADLRMIRDQLGPDYGGVITGLEKPVEWEQLDELELGLYIRYQLTARRDG